MIEMCSTFADNSYITFICKKSVCIKFGGMTHDYEHVTLNGTNIDWVSKIKHLGNHLDISCNDELDCQTETSRFISCVNKLIVNFGHLRGDVLNKLFKLYCCSFYGSQMWRLGSVYFNKVCTAWNIAVRKIRKTAKYHTSIDFGPTYESTSHQFSIAETLYSLPT